MWARPTGRPVRPDHGVPGPPPLGLSAYELLIKEVGLTRARCCISVRRSKPVGVTGAGVLKPELYMFSKCPVGALRLERDVLGLPLTSWSKSNSSEGSGTPPGQVRPGDRSARRPRVLLPGATFRRSVGTDRPALVMGSLAVSDNGPQMTSGSTREFMALHAIAVHFGRPATTPTDQAWIETFFGHLKAEVPHLLRITEPAALSAELDHLQVPLEYREAACRRGICDPTTSTPAAVSRSARTARPVWNEPDRAGLPITEYTSRSMTLTTSNTQKDPTMLANTTRSCIANSETAQVGLMVTWNGVPATARSLPGGPRLASRRS